MGLSSIASLSLGLSMSMTGTPGGVMMMRNLGVNTGPMMGGGPHKRLGGGPVHRSNNSLSQSPRPPRTPDSNKTADTTADAVQPSPAASGETNNNNNRVSEDGEVPSEGWVVADGVRRQKVAVDVEPIPVDVQVPPSTLGDSVVLVVPDLTTRTTAGVIPSPPRRTSSLIGASDRPDRGRSPDRPARGPILLSPDQTDNTSQPTISISLDSSDDEEDDDVPATSSSSAESISHILSSTQLSVDPRSYYVYNGPMNRGKAPVTCAIGSFDRSLIVREYNSRNSNGFLPNGSVKQGSGGK